jgi:hypothetical protein
LVDDDSSSRSIITLQCTGFLSNQTHTHKETETERRSTRSLIHTALFPLSDRAKKKGVLPTTCADDLCVLMAVVESEISGTCTQHTPPKRTSSGGALSHATRQGP